MQTIQEYAYMLRTIELETPPGDALVDFSAQAQELVAACGVNDGLCALIVPHTTAGITINSALDAATPEDIIAELRRIVPTRVDFAHQYDTPADAAGHIKAALVGHSLLLPIADGGCCWAARRVCSSANLMAPAAARCSSRSSEARHGAQNHH